MDPFSLDARITTNQAMPEVITTSRVSAFVTLRACSKTPICSKISCQCTTVGACTSGCRRQ